MNQLKNLWRNYTPRWLSGLATNPIWRSDQIGAVIGLLILFLAFSFLSPNFRQIENLLLIATMASTIGVVAVGQTLVLITGGIDLSVSSIVALTGLVAASLMKYGLGPIPPLTGSRSYVAIVIGMFIGMVIGAGQGWLIANRRLPPFIVTLATMVGLGGLAQAFSYGLPTHSLPDDFKWISDGHLWVIPIPALIMLAIFGIAWYILHNTKFGRYCYAVGGNEAAARLSGVNVERHKISVYAINGLLAGLAGMILIAYIDGAAPTNGGGYELYSIAAAIIGGVSLGGGVGRVWGTLVGVLIITVIPNGLIMLNAQPWWRDTITGAIILVALLIDGERHKARQSASRIIESSPILTGQYLNEVLARVTRAMDDHLGFVYCRIYLANRDTGDLIPQPCSSAGDQQQMNEYQVIPGRGGIVYEAREKGRPVRVPDITRRGGVVPLNPEAQSALALPVIVHKRVIGVIEVQSPVPNAFRDEAVKLLGGLTSSMAQMLEDAWLLESGWLVNQTRDALRHLWVDLYLGRSALAEWALTTHDVLVEYTPAKRGEALRQVLLSTIESLLSPSGENHDSSSQRGYRILQLTYVQESLVDEITRELHISRRQYFYDLKEALEALADALVRNHQASLQAQHTHQEDRT
jgi:ribose transport system permease protein